MIGTFLLSLSLGNVDPSFVRPTGPLSAFDLSPDPEALAMRPLVRDPEPTISSPSSLNGPVARHRWIDLSAGDGTRRQNWRTPRRVAAGVQLKLRPDTGVEVGAAGPVGRALARLVDPD